MTTDHVISGNTLSWVEENKKFQPPQVSCLEIKYSLPENNLREEISCSSWIFWLRLLFTGFHVLSLSTGHNFNKITDQDQLCKSLLEKHVALTARLEIAASTKPTVTYFNWIMFSFYAKQAQIDAETKADREWIRTRNGRQTDDDISAQSQEEHCRLFVESLQRHCADEINTAPYNGI